MFLKTAKIKKIRIKGFELTSIEKRFWSIRITYMIDFPFFIASLNEIINYVSFKQGYPGIVLVFKGFFHKSYTDIIIFSQRERILFYSC